MLARPMGFGRGRGVGAKAAPAKSGGGLFANVDTSGTQQQSAPAPMSGGFSNGGTSSFGQSNGGAFAGAHESRGGGGGFGGGSSFGNGGGASFGGGGGGGDGCRICHEDGHFARECPNKPPGGDGCRICKEEGHFARECPNKPPGSDACFRCKQEGHFANDCPNEEVRDPDAPPKSTYIPTFEANESSLFDAKDSVQQGINFDRYDKINVKMTGPDNELIKIIQSFQELNFGDQIQRNIARVGYTKPTPVQKYALPVVMGGRDVMACAQTGSGKTAAFVLPMLKIISTAGVSSSEFSMTQTPDALVVTPTRELAIQIYKECSKFSFNTMIKTQVAYGGTHTGAQINNIKRGCNILIGTPGRLKHFIENGTISLEKIKFFCLDEADRMLDQGFGEEIEFFANRAGMPTKEIRQTMMFSATFPEEVQALAKDFLRGNYIFITVGTVGAAAGDVTQTVMQVQWREKTDNLKEQLNTIGKGGKVLIFVKTKKQADFIASLLCQEDYPATSIHGDRLQKEREEALRDFTTGTNPILVATSVAARGLDIPGITHVINYDMPETVDEYVHRIGRTGRAGNKGASISFFDEEKDSDLARELVKILSGAEQDVPSWLESLCDGCVGSGGWNTGGRGGGWGGEDARGNNWDNGGDSGWNSNNGPPAEEVW